MLDNMTNQNLIILLKKMYSIEERTEVEQKLFEAVRIEIQRRKVAGVI